MGGEGKNSPSLGLSHRTEATPHPIAISQEAREALEDLIPVCVSTANQRLTEIIYVSPRDVQRLQGAPHPTSTEVWGLFLTPSFCALVHFKKKYHGQKRPETY